MQVEIWTIIGHFALSISNQLFSSAGKHIREVNCTNHPSSTTPKFQMVLNENLQVIGDLLKKAEARSLI
jgi:hypothetical protein